MLEAILLSITYGFIKLLKSAVDDIKVIYSFIITEDSVILELIERTYYSSMTGTEVFQD